jgi:sucrose-6-phosphate hydrolase SacC (GH32 family)
MKQVFFFAAILFFCTQAYPRGKNNDKFNEPYRPQFHFSTETNKLGAPVGLIKSDTCYHLFYQHNPHNFQNGFYNWGHATSEDLLQWDFHESMLQQAAAVSDSMQQTPWWGTVIQQNHTMYAWYNSWGEGIFKTHATNNFVWQEKIKTTGTDSLKKCEPYVFWHEASSKWVMIVYDRNGSKMYILRSPNGKDWEEVNSFSFNYGFPGMTELPVDRKKDDTRWLFFTEKGNYLLAGFDGEKMELLSPLKKFDYGKDVGTTVCYYDQQEQRHLMISQLNSKQQPNLPSNGQFTFPSEATLHELPTGIELFRSPAKEIKLLHEKTYTWEDKKIYPGLDNNLLSRLRHDAYHIKGTIELINCDQFGFIVRCGRDKVGTEINYHVDRKQLSLLNNRVDYTPKNNLFEFELLIDRSSIELFIEGGRYVISTTFTPDPDKNRYMLYTIGGEILVKNLEVHELKSIWNNK